MLVNADLIAVTAVVVGPGYVPPAGLVPIASDDAAIGDFFDPVTGSFSAPVIPLARRRATLLAKVNELKATILALGAPFGGKRILVDDASRADLSGLALTAALVEMGALNAWPESYSQGWICLDNSRVPLPSPQDGVNLAATAASWYSVVVQFARTAKDIVLNAEDPEAAFDALDWSPWIDLKKRP